MNESTAVKNKVCYVANPDNFAKIPGSPIAYWVSENILRLYEKTLVSDYAFSDGQILTGNNDKYIRLIWEVDATSIHKSGAWMLHAKGGEFRRWWGNLDSVVCWKQEAILHYKNDKIARFPKKDVMFREGITWTLISSNSVFGTRYLPSSQTFNKAAATLLLKDNNIIMYLLAFTNTNIATLLMEMLNPTLNTNIKDVLALPFILANERKFEVDELTKKAIVLSKIDWDSYETSWDFKKHPLI